MPDLKPLILHSLGSAPNPWKVRIILAELDLPYVVEEHEMAELKQEPFVALNPNGRTPALVDPNQNDITLWESGAIINYLIDTYDKEDRLHYTSGPEKHLTRCWEHFQMSGQGPYWGQMGWFMFYHPEKLPSVIERYEKEVERTIGVIDAHLAKRGSSYLVGEKATYADLMFVPYCVAAPAIYDDGFDTSRWKYYQAWLDRLLARPTTQKLVAEFKGLIAARKANQQK